MRMDCIYLHRRRRRSSKEKSEVVKMSPMAESKVLSRREGPTVDAVFYITACRDKTGLDVKYINSLKGRGVFALSAFAKGEFVLECRGQLINSKESASRQRLYHTCLKAFMFDFLWHGKFWTIDAALDDCSLGRLVNDDQVDPNCKLKRIFVAGKPHLCLFALRDITHGEEITYKYKYGDFPWRTQGAKCETAAGTNRLESDGSSANDHPDAKCSPHKSPSHIQDSSDADTSRFLSANLPCKKLKNQLVKTLPFESPRVCLQQVRGLAGPDYFIGGYREKNENPSQMVPLRTIPLTPNILSTNLLSTSRLQKAYTITHDPLPKTTKDLCKMLCRHISTTRVKPTKLCKIERDALLWMIQQFQFPDWPKQGVLRTDEEFNNVIGQVYKTKVQFNQDGPVTVQCRTMLKVMVMDLFLMVKTLHIQRPAVVLTEDQYQLYYRAALEYLERFHNTAGLQLLSKRTRVCVTHDAQNQHHS